MTCCKTTAKFRLDYTILKDTNLIHFLYKKVVNIQNFFGNSLIFCGIYFRLLNFDWKLPRETPSQEIIIEIDVHINVPLEFEQQWLTAIFECSFSDRNASQLHAALDYA